MGGELTDPVLLRHLLWIAVASGLPLQLHAGLGEPGLRIDRTDPVLLTDFVRATAGLGTDLVLLHGYPYHRHAAHLAGVFPHVYADSGAALVRTGARAATVLAEILELAPFGKILFSSGAHGLPELHVVGARLFREALGRVLGGWVAEGAWSLADAQRVAGLIAAGNARQGVRDGVEPALRPGGRWAYWPGVHARLSVASFDWPGTSATASGRSRRASSTRRTAIHTRAEPSMCRPTRISGRSVKYWT